MSDGPTDLFSEACGLSGPLKVHIEGPRPQDPSALEFRHPFLVVGRDRFADVPIDDPEVSRRHGYFQVVAGRVFCLDLGSRTGIHMDEGPRLASWVDRGKGVRVGPLRIRFEGVGAGQGGDLPISRSFQWPDLTEARLEFLGADSSREAWQISRTVVLMGSSPTCRIQLDGSGVGRIHAAIVRTPRGIWAVDLQGPGGITVRGASTRYSLLEDGDEISLGYHRLRVKIGPAAPRSVRSDLAKRSTRAVVQPTKATSDPDARNTVDALTPTLDRESRSSSQDSATTRMFEEFDRMHQRTIDQFQQAMLMMFRMHQDQMDTIRNELSRLDRLEDEQKELRAELSRGTSPQPHRMTLRLVSGDPPYAPHFPEARLPDESGSAPVVTSGLRPPIAFAPEGLASDQTSTPAPGHRSGIVPPPSSETDLDPHARLSRRIAEIHEERQGLWKRIVASLAGDPSQKHVP